MGSHLRIRLRPFARALSVAAAAAWLAAVVGASPAEASLRPVPCNPLVDVQGASCATLTVPIDRSGRVHGTTKLFVEHVPARHRSSSTMVVFPGGPGLSATLVASTEVAALHAGLADHDLLLLDQRGTGRSDYLNCDVALTPTYYVPLGSEQEQFAKTIERCAKRLGPKRAFYTTRDTTEDLEAVRAAAGIDKLDLIGISYGTRDAMDYARTYPQHVAKVVLDSLVPDSGLDAFGLDSLHAIPRILRQLCRGGGCNGITQDPVADLRTLVTRIGQAPLRARRAVSFGGCRLRPPITRSWLDALLAASDMDPQLLAQLPVAIAAAAHDDAYKLSELRAVFSPYMGYCVGRRLLRAAQGHSAAAPRSSQLQDLTFSPAEQVAMLCEEMPLPWPRSAKPSERRRDAEQFLAAFPDAAFDPFDRATVLTESDVPLCKYWMAAPEPPVLAAGPLPPVPTLILSGLDDIRTPTEGALALAQQTPTAQLLTVPDVGHSLLVHSGCARRGFAHFMAGQPISQCHAYPTHRPAPARHVDFVRSLLEQAVGY